MKEILSLVMLDRKSAKLLNYKSPIWLNLNRMLCFYDVELKLSKIRFHLFHFYLSWLRKLETKARCGFFSLRSFQVPTGFADSGFGNRIWSKKKLEGQQGMMENSFTASFAFFTASEKMHNCVIESKLELQRRRKGRIVKSCFWQK